MRKQQELSTLQKRWLLEEPAERGKRYYWRGLGVVCLVLLLGGSDPLPELPSNVIELADEASEICGEAVESPLESECSESVWKACEKARIFWQAIPPRNDDIDVWSVEEKARFLPHNYICRVAHTAELAEMSAVVEDKYGGEIWEKIPESDWCANIDCYRYYYPASVYDEGFWRRIVPYEVYPSTDFWRFRVYVSYASWDFGRGVRFEDLRTSRQWIDAVGDLRDDRDIPMTYSTKASISSLFENISRLIRIYDIWPIQASPLYEAMPRHFWPERLFGSYRSIEQTPWVISEADSEEVLLCQRALVAARVGQVGWEGDIDRCKSDAAGCDGGLTSIRQYCESLAVLAEMERKWQLLPSVCAATQDLGTVDDECRRAALEICGVDEEEREGLDRFLKRRFYDIHNSACAIARPLEVYLESEQQA